MSVAPPSSDTEDAQTWQEAQCADAPTLKARRWISDVFAVLPSVMGYLRECHGERLADLYGKEGAEEIWREAGDCYRALVDAARRADETRSRVRRFPLASWKAEAFRRRAVIPKDLPPEEERRRKETLARAWRKGWSAVHRLQRVTQLALFERAAPAFHANRDRKAADYVDHLTDLLVEVLRRVRQKGGRYDVPRFRLVSAACVEEFRAAHEPYAPQWKTGLKEGGAAIKAPGARRPSKPRREVSPTARAECVIRRAAGEVAEIAAALAPDEADALAVLLFERAGEEWQKKTGRALPFRRVLVVADGAGNGGGRAGVYGADSSDGAGEFPAKTEEPAETTADLKSAARAVEYEPEPEPRGVNLAEAEMAADAFASVGVADTLVVFKDDTKPKDAPAEYAERMSLAEFKRRLPEFLGRNARSPVESFFPRARFKGDTRLVQLDDCNPEVLGLLAPFSFIHFATSPGSAQAWLALADDLTPERYDGLRRRLLERLKPTGANGGPYGASRWPGSLNRKPERRYPDGGSPRVQLLRVAHGRRVAVAELEAADLLAPPREKPSADEVRVIRGRFPAPGEWPDLGFFLARKGNRSDAEAAWCVRALGMGHARAQVEAELSRIGSKALQRGRDNYVRDTVTNASRWLGLQNPPEHCRDEPRGDGPRGTGAA